MSQVIYNLSVLYIKTSFDIISTVCELNLTLVAEPAHVEYYMVAVVLLINDHWDCWSSHYSGIPNFYPSTAGLQNFTPLLRDTKILPLQSETVKLYLSTTRHQSSTRPSNHCRTAKLYLTTARQPNYQRNKLPLLHWISYHCVNWELTKGSKPGSDSTWPVSIQQTWIMDQMDTEIWEILYGFKTERGRRWRSSAQHAYTWTTEQMTSFAHSNTQRGKPRLITQSKESQMNILSYKETASLNALCST